MKKQFLFLGLAVVALVAATVSCCGKEAEDQKTSSDATEAVINNIMQRKSVRSYDGRALSADTIETLMRAAMAAPTGMDIRPWHIVVMTDKSQYENAFAGNHNMEKFMQSGAVFVLCADTTVTRPPRENPNAPAETKPNRLWRDDMGACTENLLLAVEAYGLGAVWTACYPFEETMKPVREYLNLPGNIIPYCIVPVGYPAGDNQPKDKWDTTRVHFNRW